MQEGLGLRQYGQEEDMERRRQIEETRRIQELIEQQARQQRMNDYAAQNSGGNSSAGSFMSGMGSGYSNAMQIQNMMGSSGGSAAGGSGGAAGGSGGGGWGLSSLFGGGGSAAGGGAAASGGGAAASGGSAAGGAASSGASALASAGPWAALAAVIIANESNARDNDYRSKDDKQYAKDLIGGKVLEQDVNQRWSKKLGGYDDDKTGMINDMGAAAEFSTFDFSNGWDKIENGTLGKIGKGIKKLF